MTVPRDIDLELSTILLSTFRSPGVVKLAGHDRPKRWTVKSAKGSTGASMTLEGDDPASFTATFFLSDDRTDGGRSQFDEWDAFQRLIESTTSVPKPFALPIYHPDLARNKKENYMKRYGRPGTENGWHFLTGSQQAIDAATEAAGFGYKWDEKSNQFAHAGGIMIATPEGKLSRYFYGIDYSPKDVKFGIMESADSHIGNAAEQLLLYCYHYDPATGKYGLAILSVMRVVSVLMLLGMGAMGLMFWRRNRKQWTVDSEQWTDRSV